MKARIILIVAVAVGMYWPSESAGQCQGGCGRSSTGMAMKSQQGGAATGMGKGARKGQPSRSDQFQCSQALAAFPIEVLSEAERSSLNQMREEEKLARDVYTALYKKWNLQIFSNILNAENRHMEAMGCLLARYELSDPAYNLKEGEFTNKELQKAYDELVKEGFKSMEAALRTGAYIEDLDIFDLEAAMKVIDNADIQAIYKDLVAASGNHIRAFSRQLAQRGVSYTPNMLTKEAYEAVLAGEHQSCGVLHP